MTVIIAVAKEVRASAVSVVALKLPQPTVARRAGGGLVGAVPAVPLTVTLPPDGNTTVEMTDNQCIKSRTSSVAVNLNHQVNQFDYDISNDVRQINTGMFPNRSLLAHRYWVLVHIGRHRLTPPIWTVRKWSGHSQVCSRPP